jgi:pyruvate carboxylase subunit B
MLYHVRVGGRDFQVELRPGGVWVDGEAVEVDLAHVGGTPVRSLLLDGASYRFVASRRGPGEWDLHVGGRRLRAEVVDERTRVIREMTAVAAGPAGPTPVRAPMPGMVVRVEVAEGDGVRAGQGVVIIEAMKMENELCAEGAGVVVGVRVREGQAVEKDQILVDIEPAEEAAD